MATQKKKNPIKQYTKKDGSTAYMFKKYLGVNPETGKQVETTRRGFKSIKEAKLAYSRLTVEVEENGLSTLQKKKRTFKEVFEEWSELVYSNKVGETTYWNTMGLFDTHILPKLGKKQIGKITITTCQRAANAWVKDSPKRYYRFINYAGMVLKYATTTGELSSNPMDKITMPKPAEEISEEPEVLNFYDREELAEFLSRLKKSKASDKRYALFFLLAYTGLRKGESLALTWRDIDFKQKALTVNKTLAVGKGGKLLVKTPKTKASIRTISLDDDTLAVLKEWQSKQQEQNKLLGFLPDVNQLVFSKSEDNGLMYPRTPITWLDTFARTNKDMKVITPHGFRHTHASLLFEAGATMKQVQARLGHSNIKTTMNIYTHVTQAGKEETALIFSDYMKNGKSLGQSLGQKKSPTQ